MNIEKITKEWNDIIKADNRFEFNKLITENIYNYQYSFVAIENNEAVGFVYAVKLMGKNTILVLAINTRKDKYNLGIGEEMLRFLEDKAKQDNIKEILLFYEESIKLNRFYEKSGFETNNNMKAIIKELK